MKNPLSERVDNAEHEEDQSDLVKRNSGLQKEIACQMRTTTERNTSHTTGLSNTMARNDGRYNGGNELLGLASVKKRTINRPAAMNQAARANSGKKEKSRQGCKMVQPRVKFEPSPILSISRAPGGISRRQITRGSALMRGNDFQTSNFRARTVALIRSPVWLDPPSCKPSSSRLSFKIM
jgi:hypothetical protein